MGTTVVSVDRELLERVRKRLGAASGRDAAEAALRRVAGDPMTRAEALAMEGTGWEGDLEGMRTPREF